MLHDPNNANPNAYARAFKCATAAHQAALDIEADAARLCWETIETTAARREAIALHKATEALIAAAELVSRAAHDAKTNAARREEAARIHAERTPQA